MWTEKIALSQYRLIVLRDKLAIRINQNIIYHTDLLTTTQTFHPQWKMKNSKFSIRVHYLPKYWYLVTSKDTKIEMEVQRLHNIWSVSDSEASPCCISLIWLSKRKLQLASLLVLQFKFKKTQVCTNFLISVLFASWSSSINDAFIKSLLQQTALMNAFKLVQSLSLENESV